MKIERFYRALAIVPRVGLPEGHPAEADLERRGYQRDTGWTKFLRGTEPASAPATDLRVRPVRPADAERYDEIVRTALGFPDMVRGWFAQFPFQPGVHCLGAYDGDLLVGTGTLVVHGDHADMTWGATAPEHRGRGAQGALMAARIDLARRLGVTTIGTATGLPGPDGPGPSHRNMLRAGFEPVHVRRWWQRRT